MAEEIWSVRLPTGDVRRGSLDDLDAAFEAGHIDENALVLAPGATKWTKLGELAGLDADDAPPPAPAAVSVAPYPSPNSLRPVMMDVDDFSYDAPRRSSKGPVLLGIVGAAALIGGIVFAVHQFATGSETSTATAAVMATTLVTAPPAPPPPPALPVADTAPASIGPSLTDTQKQALLVIDKKHAKDSKEHKKSRDAAAAAAGGGWQHHSHSSTAEPKRKAGQGCSCSRGDPLCTCL